MYMHSPDHMRTHVNFVILKTARMHYGMQIYIISLQPKTKFIPLGLVVQSTV
jgi:hypothetical protein